MTIAVAVKVPEGVVLATDSRTTIKNQQGQVLKTYDNVQKIFSLKDLPVGIITWGLGNIQARTIQSYVEEFQRNLQINESDFKIAEIAKNLKDFFSGTYNSIFASTPQDKRPYLGFYIAGYEPNNLFAEEYQIKMPTFQVNQIRPKNNFGGIWRGEAIWITRFIKGYDPRTLSKLSEAGFDKEQIQKIESTLHQYEIPFIFDGMPLQDAIDYAIYIVQIVIGLYRFRTGAPTCGGPIDVAIITLKEKFKWIQSKQLRGTGK